MHAAETFTAGQECMLELKQPVVLLKLAGAAHPGTGISGAHLLDHVITDADEFAVRNMQFPPVLQQQDCEFERVARAAPSTRVRSEVSAMWKNGIRRHQDQAIATDLRQ